MLASPAGKDGLARRPASLGFAVATSLDFAGATSLGFAGAALACFAAGPVLASASRLGAMAPDSGRCAQRSSRAEVGQPSRAKTSQPPGLKPDAAHSDHVARRSDMIRSTRELEPDRRAEREVCVHTFDPCAPFVALYHNVLHV